MSENNDILRLRILLCFFNEDAGGCNVTNIARTLGIEKYTVSRILKALEQEGLVDRSNSRMPILTEYGLQEAKRYAERIKITTNHLRYEGVDSDSAQRDALYWALYNSERTMEVIRETEERYRVKYELREEKWFTGKKLCKKLNDGIYQFPFLIYKEHAHNGNNFSMANEAFENPCTLAVKNGVGVVKLWTKSVTAKSAATGQMMSGQIKTLRYLDHGNYVNAEIHGNVISFPAEVLHFVNIGSKEGQILHGSVFLQMESTANKIHMPDVTAIFTILI